MPGGSAGVVARGRLLSSIEQDINGVRRPVLLGLTEFYGSIEVKRETGKVGSEEWGVCKMVEYYYEFMRVLGNRGCLGLPRGVQAKAGRELVSLSHWANH